MTLLKTDQEEGLERIFDQVHVLRSQEHMPTLRERSKPHEHQTNGLAEIVNHHVARHATLILLELEERAKSTLDRDMNFLLWLPEYAAMIKNRFHKKYEHTPYFRVHSKECHEKML